VVICPDTPSHFLLSHTGIIKEWEGPVGTLRCGVFTAFPCTPARFIAPRGMRSLAEHIATQATSAEIRRPLWVGEAIHNDAGWQLLGRGRSQGYFDAVVISHNGKCANKLSAPMGVPLVHRQLRSLK
jgi:predicted NAD/FAD-dependent oxidoreductase